MPGTPYIVLFAANYKSGIIYRENRGLNSLIEFVVSHSEYDISASQ